jgi:hypothetical protein|tara:strand:- start:17 stop:211 length:195 start_codon:yes stop_codon:yes gene_type:complete
MDIEYLIIGTIFLVSGLAILIYKFKSYGIDDDDTGGFKYNSIGGAIMLILLAIYILMDEIMKII